MQEDVWLFHRLTAILTQTTRATQSTEPRLRNTVHSYKESFEFKSIEALCVPCFIFKGLPLTVVTAEKGLDSLCECFSSMCVCAHLPIVSPKPWCHGHYLRRTEK